MSRVSVKLLGISGSPRKGNSLFLLKKSVEAAKRTGICRVEDTIYSFQGKRFAPCLHCSKCTKTGGECIQQDDFQNLRDLWLESEVILYSVPVYHWGIPGQLKCFFDRLGHTLLRQPPDSYPLKVIGCMTQGVDSYAGQEFVLNELVRHALIMQSIPFRADSDFSGRSGRIGIGTWTCGDSESDALERQYQDKESQVVTAVSASENMAKGAVELAFVLRLGVSAAKKRLAKISDYNPSSFLERFF